MRLPDINVWLALTFDAHVHHPAAKTWFDGLSNNDVCFFCRLTQQGFLRLASNPKVFGKDAVTSTEAWQKYDIFLTDLRIAFADEPAGLDSHWRSFSQGQTFSPQVWSDAYLAAFAVAGQLELVTFDKGFGRYTNLVCTILP
jgi:uncharacterized protein